MNLVIAVVVAVLTLPSYLRWLRVAQREHYEPGRVLAMISVWCRAVPREGAVLVVVAIACVVGVVVPVVAVVGVLAWLAWPLGLGLLNKAAPLVFTDRVKRLVVATLLVHVITALALGFLGVIALLPLAVPLVLELALLITGRIETALGRRYLVSAAAQVKKLHPRVVAITGSYGKTSTKNYAAHLMSGRFSVLASPASFNNVMGLSRAINDRLEPGTDVFVAEMGTYGPGEIAALCEIFPPEVSAIVTIGEAHLERMKNRETIVRAKSEILPPAKTVVLNVDVPELAAIADDLAASKRVIRCSVEGAPLADVVVRRSGPGRDAGWQLLLGEETFEVALPPETGHPINVAIAVGLALALDVPQQSVIDRLATVPSTPHRAETTQTAAGLTLIDDTYNSNPDGAAQAVVTARELVAEGGTVWTLTPGMVELGSAQAERNAEFARLAAAGPRMTLGIIGRTNRTALVRGAAQGPGQVLTFANREAAVGHVMASAVPGDVVLYENDLPDHYP